MPGDASTELTAIRQTASFNEARHFHAGRFVIPRHQRWQVSRGFNEARHFHAGRLDFTILEGHRDRASMRPGIFMPGDFTRGGERKER